MSEECDHISIIVNEPNKQASLAFIIFHKKVLKVHFTKDFIQIFYIQGLKLQ